MVTEEPTGRLGFPKAALSRCSRQRWIWILKKVFYIPRLVHKHTYTCLQIRRSMRTHMHKKRTARSRACARSLEQLRRSDGFLWLVSCRARGSGCWIISALMAPMPPPAPAECVREVAGAPVAVMREKLSRQI